MSLELELCVFCPRLCRHVCPVAIVSGREAATPTALITAVFLGLRGDLEKEVFAQALSLCTRCGACTEHCKLHVPVGRILASLRAALLPVPPVQALSELRGEGGILAIECDDRAWGLRLQGRLAAPVARLSTGDHLGFAILDHPNHARDHLSLLRERVGARRPVSSCGYCTEVLRAAGLDPVALHQLLPMDWSGPRLRSCRFPLDGPDLELPRMPCGGTDPFFSYHHPLLAAELAREAALGLSSGVGILCLDSGCASGPKALGSGLLDPIDLLMQGPLSGPGSGT